MSLSRRDFFKVGGVGALAATVAPGTLAQSAAVPAGAAVLSHPTTLVAEIGSLDRKSTVSFNYPDSSSPCQLLKMGRQVPGGVGPDGDIVAYSILCPHMGCPTQYDGEARSFKCGCHFSVFDPEMEGQQVCGQATRNMPRIELNFDAARGTVEAVGVHGLIYGRQANTL